MIKRKLGDNIEVSNPLNLDPSFLYWQNIQMIPNNNPKAIPSLWNVTFNQIEDNFRYIMEAIQNIEFSGDNILIEKDTDGKLTIKNNSITMDKLAVDSSLVDGTKTVTGSNLKVANNNNETIQQAINRLSQLDSGALSGRIDTVTQMLLDVISELDMMKDSPYESNGPFWVVLFDYIGEYGFKEGLLNFISDHDLKNTSVGWRLKQFVPSKDEAGIETQNFRYLAEPFHYLQGFALEIENNEVLHNKISYYNGYVYILKGSEYLLKVDAINGEIISTYSFSKEVKELSNNKEEPFSCMTIDNKGIMYLVTNPKTDVLTNGSFYRYNSKIMKIDTKFLPKQKNAIIDKISFNITAVEVPFHEREESFMNDRSFYPKHFKPFSTGNALIKTFKIVGITTDKENVYILSEPIYRDNTNEEDAYGCGVQFIRRFSKGTNNVLPSTTDAIHKIDYFVDVSEDISNEIPKLQQLVNKVDQIQIIDNNKSFSTNKVEMLFYKPTDYSTLNQNWKIFRVKIDFQSSALLTPSKCQVLQQISDGKTQDYIGKFFINDENFSYLHYSFLSYYKDNIYRNLDTTKETLSIYKFVYSGYRQSFSRNIKSENLIYGFSSQEYTNTNRILNWISGNNFNDVVETYSVGSFKSVLEDSVLNVFHGQNLVCKIDGDIEVVSGEDNYYNIPFVLVNYDNQDTYKLDLSEDLLKHTFINVKIDNKSEYYEIYKNITSNDKIIVKVYSEIDLTSEDIVIDKIINVGFPKFESNVISISKQGKILYNNFDCVENNLTKNVFWKKDNVKSLSIPQIFFNGTFEQVISPSVDIRVDSLYFFQTQYGKIEEKDKSSNYSDYATRELIKKEVDIEKTENFEIALDENGNPVNITISIDRIEDDGTLTNVMNNTSSKVYSDSTKNSYNDYLFPFNTASNGSSYRYLEKNKLYKITISTTDDVYLPGVEYSSLNINNGSTITDKKHIFFNLTDSHNRASNVQTNSKVSQIIENNEQMFITYDVLQGEDSYSLSVIGDGYTKKIRNEDFINEAFQDKNVYTIFRYDRNTTTGVIDLTSAKPIMSIDPDNNPELSFSEDIPSVINPSDSNYLDNETIWNNNKILIKEYLFNIGLTQDEWDTDFEPNNSNPPYVFYKQQLYYPKNHVLADEPVVKKHYNMSKILNIIDDKIYFMTTNYSAPCITPRNDKGFPYKWSSGYSYYEFSEIYKTQFVTDNSWKTIFDSSTQTTFYVPSKYREKGSSTWLDFTEDFPTSVPSTIWKNFTTDKFLANGEVTKEDTIPNYSYEEICYFTNKGFQSYGSVISVYDRNTFSIVDKWNDDEFETTIKTFYQTNSEIVNNLLVGFNWKFPFFKRIDRYNGKMSYFHQYLNIPSKQYEYTDDYKIWFQSVYNTGDWSSVVWNIYWSTHLYYGSTYTNPNDTGDIVDFDKGIYPNLDEIEQRFSLYKRIFDCIDIRKKIFNQE